MSASGIDTWTPEVLPGGTILIADQEASVRVSVGSFLRELGFQPRYASDRKAAAAMLAMEPVDLILVDLRLATGSKEPLLEMVRDRYPDVPVVVMTAQRYVNDAIECIRSGASDYLTKPLNMRYLGRCIAGLVAERQSRPAIGFVDPFHIEAACVEAPTRIGNYELSGVIGAGATGSVHLARRVRDGLGGKSYALKLLKLAGNTDYAREVSLRRFLNEVETASLIRHECVVEIIEYGVADGGRPFIVMEHCSGRTLRQWIDGGNHNGSPFLHGRILRQASEALDAIHEHGIVHRDIKPDNLMLDTALRLKVTDFGLAVSPTGRDGEGRELGGSPAYLAPEVFKGLPYDHRADLFSLGVVGYELVTGRRPFSADTLDDYANAICNTHPINPVRFAPNLPRALVAIIASLLEKDPKVRYQSAARVTRDLDAFLATEYRDSPSEALTALGQRRPSFRWA